VEGPLTVCDLFPAAAEYASSGLRQQDLEFAVTDQRVASNNRQMEWFILIH